MLKSQFSLFRSSDICVLSTLKHQSNSTSYNLSKQMGQVKYSKLKLMSFKLNLLEVESTT